MPKKRNGWRVIILTVIAVIGAVYMLNDRKVFSGLWTPSEVYAAHVTDFEDFKDEIKDDLADQKLLLYEVKTRVEMIQASLVRVEDKLGTGRHRRRNISTGNNGHE